MYVKVMALQLLMICQFTIPSNIVSALFLTIRADNMIYNLRLSYDDADDNPAATSA
jgi:hypothetical protein